MIKMEGSRNHSGSFSMSEMTNGDASEVANIDVCINFTRP
jgi:hypothetical protein